MADFVSILRGGELASSCQFIFNLKCTARLIIVAACAFFQGSFVQGSYKDHTRIISYHIMVCVYCVHMVDLVCVYWEHMEDSVCILKRPPAANSYSISNALRVSLSSLHLLSFNLYMDHIIYIYCICISYMVRKLRNGKQNFIVCLQFKLISILQHPS